jgi:hypothetical protein
MKAYFSILFLVFAGINPGAEVDLRYTFKVGDVYDYEQQSQQTSKQTFPGMGEMNTEASMTGVMQMKVVEVTTQGAKVEAQYSKLKMAVNSMLMKMNLDSEGDQEETSNKIAKSMMGKTFHFVLLKTGKVENVQGAENLYSDLGSIGLDADVVANTKKMLQQSLNDKSLEAILTNSFVLYPDKKVKEGDRWNTETLQTMSFPMHFQNTWSLSKMDGTNAQVNSEANMMTADKEKIMSLPNGMKTKSDLAGTQSLNASIDVKSGWPKQVNIVSNLKGNMTLLAGGLIPTDMLVPMEMKIQTTYSIKKR